VGARPHRALEEGASAPEGRDGGPHPSDDLSSLLDGDGTIIDATVKAEAGRRQPPAYTLSKHPAKYQS